MGNTTLEQIQRAEQEAREMVSSAQQEAKRLVQEADEQANARHRQDVEDAIKNADALVKEGKSGAETEAQPLLEAGKRQQEGLQSVPQATIDAAAGMIVERIVGKNGN